MLLLGPALATGGEFTSLMLTCDGALSIVPSFTISWTTYVPFSSVTNAGLTMLGFDSVVVLPCDGLVRPGIGNGRRIFRADDHLSWRTVQLSVAHHKLNSVIAGLIDHKRWCRTCRTTQDRGAPHRN